MGVSCVYVSVSCVYVSVVSVPVICVCVVAVSVSVSVSVICVCDIMAGKQTFSLNRDGIVSTDTGCIERSEQHMYMQQTIMFSMCHICVSALSAVVLWLRQWRAMISVLCVLCPCRLCLHICLVCCVICNYVCACVMCGVVVVLLCGVWRVACVVWLWCCCAVVCCVLCVVWLWCCGVLCGCCVVCCRYRVILIGENECERMSAPEREETMRHMNASAVWCMVCGVWCVACGVVVVVLCAVCCVLCVVWRVACGVWRGGVRCMVCGVWCVVCVGVSSACKHGIRVKLHIAAVS